MQILLYLLIGLFTGAMGGALGIGGGAIMVPIFVIFFGLTQHQAQGTSLAVMLPPIFLLAVWRYYVEGHVQVKMAIFVAAGFFVGALLGAHLIQNLPGIYLKRTFGVFIIIVGCKMLIGK